MISLVAAGSASPLRFLCVETTLYVRAMMFSTESPCYVVVSRGLGHLGAWPGGSWLPWWATLCCVASCGTGDSSSGLSHLFHLLTCTNGPRLN